LFTRWFIQDDVLRVTCVKRSLLLLTLLSCASVCLLAQQGSNALAPQIHPINRLAYTDSAQYQFLAPILNGVEVVSLGESIHMTHEFPLVRTGIIKYLNENMSFHVLAMEGSAPDVWIAQDRFLQSAHTQADAEDAQLGLFPIWNTPEIRQLFEYEAATWSAATPFYVAGYDIQPGNGKGSHGTSVFKMLAERLRIYAPPPDNFDLDKWVNEFAPLTNSCDGYDSAARARIEAAILLLQEWTDRAAPAVSARFSNIPHGTALSLIPNNLRASLGRCEDLAGSDRGHYTAARDKHAVQYVLQLKDNLPAAHLMIWAHLAHVYYDSDHLTTSVGEILHQSLGLRLYTISPFAEGGGAIMMSERNNNEVGYGRVHSGGALTDYLSGLSGQDYFLDLRSLNLGDGKNSLFNSPQSIWYESHLRNLALARELDGIIWIKKIHSPDFPFPTLMLFSLLSYVPYLIIAGILLLVLISGLILRRILRRRNRKQTPTA
jgi:erythromycin esterase-like protein